MEESYEIFRRNVTRLRKQKKLQQKQLADLVGIGEKHMSDILRGKANASDEVQEKIAEVLEVTWSDLFLLEERVDGHSDQERQSAERFFGVPYMRQPALNGSETGSELDLTPDIESHHAYQEAWLRSQGNPESMRVFRVQGDSMAPAIPEGATVLIDTSQTSPQAYKVYAALYNNQMLVKRLVPAGPNWLLASDRGDTPITVGEQDSFSIIGRVLNVSFAL